MQNGEAYVSRPCQWKKKKIEERIKGGEAMSRGEEEMERDREKREESGR